MNRLWNFILICKKAFTYSYMWKDLILKCSFCQLKETNTHHLHPQTRKHSKFKYKAPDSSTSLASNDLPGVIQTVLFCLIITFKRAMSYNYSWGLPCASPWIPATRCSPLVAAWYRMYSRSVWCLLSIVFPKPSDKVPANCKRANFYVIKWTKGVSLVEIYSRLKTHR